MWRVLKKCLFIQAGSIWNRPALSAVQYKVDSYGL